MPSGNSRKQCSECGEDMDPDSESDVHRACRDSDLRTRVTPEFKSFEQTLADRDWFSDQMRNQGTSGGGGPTPPPF